MVRKNGENQTRVTAGNDVTSAPEAPNSQGFDERTITSAERPLLAVHCPTCGLAVVPGTQTCPIDGTTLFDSPAPDLVGLYEFGETLGTGGMSVVYRAKHLLLGHTVAIKLLNSSSVHNPTILRRFRLEAAAAKKVEHPNVIRIHDFGITQSGQPYMVMDCLEGRTLSQLIKSKGTLSVSEALPLFKQICLALHHLHTHSVLHRDLKPSNVFITEKNDGSEPVVKLVDFGIAKVLDEESTDGSKLTATGDVFGTPQYMSPEQCMGAQVTAESDIYSLGCLMYEAVSGRTPFQAENPLAMMQQHMQDTASRLPGTGENKALKSLEEIIFKCMEKESALRYHTAEALFKDLDKLEAGEFRRQPISHKLRRFIGRHKDALIGTAVAVVIGIGTYGYWMMKSHEPTPGDTYLMQHWQEWQGQTELNLADSGITDISMPYVAKLTQVRKLYLGKTNITDAGARYLAQLPNLETLQLAATNISDQGVKELGGLKHLSTIDLSDTKISERSIEYLSRFPALWDLDLSGSMLPESVLRKTAILSRLSTLHINDRPLTAGILDALPSALTSLDLTQCKTSDSALKELRRFQHLRWLRLSKNNDVTNDTLTTIAQLHGLENLDLAETAVTGSGLSNLEGLHQLKGLFLGKTQLRALQKFPRLGQLRELDLRSTGLTDASLPAVQTLSSLERLNLMGNGITASGLSQLHSLSNLQELFVDLPTVMTAKGGFSPEATSNLHALPRFKTLNVAGLSREQVSEFAPTLPFGLYQVTM